jgi:HSP20 family protein
LAPDAINLNVTDGQLTLSGEKPVLGRDIRADAYHRNERTAGRFVRTIALPSAVDRDNTKAEYRNGILTVTLPKAESAKPKRIEVKIDA